MIDSESAKRDAERQERGRQRFESLIAHAGGTLTIGEVSKFLDISELHIADLVQKGTLISLQYERSEDRFPRFQFDKLNGSILHGIPEVRKALGEINSIELTRFLLVPPDPTHSDECPLDLLRAGHLAHVLILARLYHQQRP